MVVLEINSALVGGGIPHNWHRLFANFPAMSRGWRNMPSSHSINRLFVFVDYANKLSPTLKSSMFASARSECPEFLFKILIEEGQRIISMLISTRYLAYQDTV